MIDPRIAEDDSAERARRGRLALVISIAFNLVGLALFVHFLALRHEPAERRSPVEVVTIEKKRPAVPVIEKREVIRRPVPVVQPKTRANPASAPAPVARAPKITPPLPLPKENPHRAELAKNGGGSRQRPQPAPAQAGALDSKRTRLSASKIAAITQDLQGEIDRDRGGHGALDVKPEPAPTMKHYAMDLGDLASGSLSHHGLCDPIRDWHEDGYDYYYVACNVRFSDGTFQRQDVPWPVRFLANDDPFNGTGKAKALAMPLPGWHLPAGETVTVELREYAHDHGVDI